MRVLLSTIGSRGDVQPLVALAVQLRARAHDVRLCVPPDFQEWIEGLGFVVTPIGPRLRAPMAAGAPAVPAPPSPERRRQMVEGTVATQFETIAAAARGCDVIVGATALQIAAPSIAEAMGIPYVFAAYCPAVLPSPHHAPPPLPPVPDQAALPPTTDNRELWARDATRFSETFGPSLNSHRAARGLAPVADVRRHIFTSRPWLAADATVGPWPDAADGAVFQTGAWILPDERPLLREIEVFLDAGEPPVYFGFGSVRAAPGVGHVMVQVARALGRRAIVSTGWADLSLAAPGDEGSDCLAIGEANLQALFPRVAAVVHHGGAGTTATAALAGAPQVVVPQLYDQHYWARRVEQLGVGAAHPPGMPAIDSLASALSRALESGVAARARSVAPAVRRDGAAIAADSLAAAGG